MIKTMTPFSITKQIRFWVAVCATVMAIEAFVPMRNSPAAFRHCTDLQETTTTTTTKLFLSSSRGSRRRNRNIPDEEPLRSAGIPQLPAVGFSSYGTKQKVHIKDASPEDGQQPLPAATAFVGAKFELQYTCNICETRNCHQVSRLAYRQGVVIARCKGCDSRHLIADNLGWTNYKGGFEGDVNDIEDYFANLGRQDEVNRVSKDVFQLEKILSLDTKSGSIIGDNGELAME